MKIASTIIEQAKLRKQIELKYQQELSLFKFKHAQEILRVNILEQQIQEYKKLANMQLIEYAQTIITSLNNKNILNLKKITALPNKVEIVTELTNCIISLLKFCPGWVKESKLLYIANFIRCEKFAEFINHQNLINQYFDLLKIRYVEETITPTPTEITPAQRGLITRMPLISRQHRSSCTTLATAAPTSHSNPESTTSSSKSDSCDKVTILPRIK